MKTNKIRLTGLIVLFAFFMIMNLSCGGGGGSSSSGNLTAVSIKMTAASPSDIVKLRFTISAADMVTISRTEDVSVTQSAPLPPSPTPTSPPPQLVKASVTSGDTVFVHFDVPNGLNRHIVVEALDSTGTVIYIGDTYVDLDGIQKSIEVNLKPVGQGQLEQCNNLTLAGGDTPETHTIELGKTSGTFDFQFDTYGIEDRMILKFEGNVLYDSGCVGTRGLKSQTISYSGSSTQVTVEVQPGCAGGTSGTAWKFSVTCPL